MEASYGESLRLVSDGSASRWQDIICREFHLIEVVDRQPQACFNARLSRRGFSSGELLRLDVPRHSLTRSRSLIAKDNFCDIQFVYLAEGHVEYRQHGRTCHIEAGDCFIMDQGNPFELTVSSNRARNLAMQVPRSWLTSHFAPEDVAARRFGCDSPWGGALSAFLRAIYLDMPGSPTLSPYLMIEQALNLVQLAVEGPVPQGTTHQKGLLRRCRNVLQELCHEENLSPETVANIVGISKGYLHRLFAQDGTTFCRDLDTVRIERAAGLLAAKNRHQLTISEIGIKCGLPSAPHFTRKFRSLKGVSPSQFRQSATP